MDCEKQKRLGRVYKLVNSVDDKIYIGSTFQKLNKRLTGHKIDSRRKNSIINNYIKNIGEDKFEIILIEEVYVSNDEELRQIEDNYIDQQNPDLLLNTKRAFRKAEDYPEWKKTYMKEYNKKYKEENREKINESRKEKYLCECGSEIRKDEKINHETTQRHINFIENQIKYEKSNYPTYKCECGSEIRKDGKYKHEQSIKHINYIDKQYNIKKLTFNIQNITINN